MKDKKRGGKAYVAITYIFVALFTVMIVYLAYFQVVKSRDILENPYNTRQDKLSASVLRGSLISSDGYTLAYTATLEDGTETRIYPYDNLFAQVIGYTDYGSSGLEAMENYELLQCSEALDEQLKQTLNDEKLIGDDVVVSLNVSLQQTAYEALDGRKGAVVVLDASTSKVLACVSSPDFDPNTVYEDWEELNAEDSGSPFLNRALQGRYEPGSTFKIATALAFIRTNPDWENFTFECMGEYTQGGYTIHCAGNTAHGAQSLTDAFANSCNCAFSYIATQYLGQSALYDTACELLFNESLSLGLPSVSSSFTLETAYKDGLTMQTAIGQGNTLVTPIHLAIITQAVYNGGNMLKPSFIERVVNHSGVTVRTEGTVSLGNVMTSSEADILKSFMKAVVEYGTASSLSGLAANVAGKTGTAEFGSAEGYYHSWFTGFSNTGNNDIVVTVIVEESLGGTPSALEAARLIFEAYCPQV